MKVTLPLDTCIEIKVFHPIGIPQTNSSLATNTNWGISACDSPRNIKRCETVRSKPNFPNAVRHKMHLWTHHRDHLSHKNPPDRARCPRPSRQRSCRCSRPCTPRRTRPCQVAHSLVSVHPQGFPAVLGAAVAADTSTQPTPSSRTLKETSAVVRETTVMGDDTIKLKRAVKRSESWKW